MRPLVRTSTSLFSSKDGLSHFIESLHSLPNLKDHLLLFSLSHNTPDLEQSMLRLSSCTTHSIGCLSSPLLVESKHSFSCSIALFKRNSYVSFSTLKTGVGPTQVGRWHAYDKRKTNDVYEEAEKHDLNGRVNWDDIWNEAVSECYVPKELRNVRDARSLIYFSDNASWELAAALRTHLPRACQLGVIASATPFFTGHPFTLLRDGKVQSSGAVGIALKTPPAETVMAFEGVKRLTEPLIIKRSEGNLIHELESGLPARILLKAIQDQELSNETAKDIDYYIGLGDSGDSLPKRLLKVIAGSPSRGLVAVEEVPAPPPGSRIQFFYRQPTSSIHLPANMFNGNKRQSGSVIGAFIDTPENTQTYAHPSSIENSETATLQTHESFFTISTEHGFIYGSEPSPEIWKCTVPGAFGGFKFLM